MDYTIEPSKYKYTDWYVFLKHVTTKDWLGNEKRYWATLGCVKRTDDGWNGVVPKHYDVALPIPDPNYIPEWEEF